MSEQTPSEFYVLSLKWSHGTENLVWWNPDNKGYTIVLDRAGRYSREQIEAHRSYYDNGEDTLAVPCELAELHAVRVVTDCRKYQIIEAVRGSQASVLGGKSCPTA